MPDLVTLAQGKAHLNIETARTDLDADVALKISAASQMVLTEIGRDDLSEWQDPDSSPATYSLLPYDLIAACQLALGYLHHDREGGNPVPEAFYNVLRVYKDNHPTRVYFA